MIAKLDGAADRAKPLRGSRADHEAKGVEIR